ncbi:MAG: Y-family DNA polymerase [Ginsengibacter sp.]
MVAIVDCNNFYCSCERAFVPSLAGKPVVVLSNNDGCVISRSDEAKAIGIGMGTPIFMIGDLIKAHDVKVFSSNYSLYADMSKRVLANLASFVPRLEVYSIDEAFLDFGELKHNDIHSYSKLIRQRLIQNTGIPVSIGVAATKTLAKMANRFCKRKFKDKGVYVIENDIQRLEVLQATAAGDVWGIGGQHAKKLSLAGVKTAFDFVNLSDDYVRKEMSVIGLRTLHELRGVPSVEWTFSPPAKKGICTSRSFGKLCEDLNVLAEAVANFAANCALQLRKQNSCCKVVHVFIQTNPHRSELKQYFRAIDIQLPVASNSSAVITAHALKGLHIIYAEQYLFMKAGVIVNNIVPANTIQGGLFDHADSIKSKALMETMDRINETIGKDIVRLSAQGYERKWKLKADLLSKHYTTDFNQLPELKA